MEDTASLLSTHSTQIKSTCQRGLWVPGIVVSSCTSCHIPLYQLTDQSEWPLGRAKADDYIIELTRYRYLWDETLMEHFLTHVFDCRMLSPVFYGMQVLAWLEAVVVVVVVVGSAVPRHLP